MKALSSKAQQLKVAEIKYTSMCVMSVRNFDIVLHFFARRGTLYLIVSCQAKESQFAKLTTGKLCRHSLSIFTAG